MIFSYVPSNILWSSIAFIAAIVIAGPLLGVVKPDPGALRSFHFWDSDTLKFVGLRSFDPLVRMVFEGRIRVSVWYIFRQPWWCEGWLTVGCSAKRVTWSENGILWVGVTELSVVPVTLIKRRVGFKSSKGIFLIRDTLIRSKLVWLSCLLFPPRRSPLGRVLGHLPKSGLLQIRVLLQCHLRGSHRTHREREWPESWLPKCDMAIAPLARSLTLDNMVAASGDPYNVLAEWAERMYINDCLRNWPVKAIPDYRAES